MTRRRIIAAFSALAVSAVAAFSSVQPAEALDKVRLGKSVPFAFAFLPAEVGTEAGIWKKHGIELVVSSFGGDAKMQQGLAAGSLDIGIGSGPGLGFMAKGVPAKGVAAFAGRPYSMGLIVPYDSPLKDPSDLKGKKIGVTTVGSLTDWLAKRIAVSQGWGADGVQTVTLGGSDSMRAALRTKQVDAIIIGVEVGYGLEKRQEGKVLFTAAQFVDAYHTHVMFAHENLIKSNPALVQRIVDGWFETIAYMKANKEQTIETAHRVLKLDKDVLEQTFDLQVKLLSDNGRFDDAAIALLKDSFVEMGILDSKPESDVLFTTQFVNK
jgi:NitT/TauT family transport system substrate-binding protein